MSAFSAALSLAITPALKDPNLHWVFLQLVLLDSFCHCYVGSILNLDKWMENETNERERLDREEEEKPTEESTMLIIQLKQLYLSSHDYIFIYKLHYSFELMTFANIHLISN